MEKNGFLCKCIIIVSPTVVFLLSVFIFKSGGIVCHNFSSYEFVYHDTLWITEVAQFETETGLKEGKGRATPLFLIL